MNVQQPSSNASPPVKPAAASSRSAQPASEGGDSDGEFYRIADKLHHAAIASATLGISPISVLQAWQDWLLHLSISPGKQHEILKKLIRKQLRFAKYASKCAMSQDRTEACIAPLPQDRRFADPAWNRFPFNLYSQSFLLTQQWWHNATTGIPGVTKQHERLTEFYTRQILDMFSPSNFPATNPRVIDTTIREGGGNLLRGFGFLLEDALRHGRPAADSAHFVPGRDVAVTPGEVIFRNELIELIQYAPSTDQVQSEPLLIVPAWIMKYYILDLSPENSLIRYLVGQGFTVFCISWVNPDERHRDIGFEDYLNSGVMAAIDAVEAVTASDTIHATGYCLGGTLLTIAAAAMARDGDERLKSLTLLAAQADFDEPGELGLFIDESQISFLEDMMWRRGYLDRRQMAGAFQMLRSQDLVWSRMVGEYLLGDRGRQIDLMAWNADATRMPSRMHSEYLRKLYLNNDLSQGRLKAGGRHVHVEDIRAPVFAVGTETDHVAPWKSVFKLVHLFDTDVDFVLTSGGHNAGIVSEPGHPRRSYRLLEYTPSQPHPDAGEWAENTPARDGSWWPQWCAWLKRHSGGSVDARPVGNATSGYAPICPAPGSYVLIK